MLFKQAIAALSMTLALGAAHAQAAATAPDALIKQVSTEVIDTVKSDKAIQAGDVGKIIALVDSKVMPHVNFQRMTASAVGRHWRTLWAPSGFGRRLFFEAAAGPLVAQAFRPAVSGGPDQPPPRLRRSAEALA